MLHNNHLLYKTSGKLNIYQHVASYIVPYQQPEHSGIREFFVCGIRNPAGFGVENTVQRLRNPSTDLNSEFKYQWQRIWRGIRNPRLWWFPLHGAKHCTHTCGDEHSATLYYIQTVVGKALIQAKVFAVDNSKLQSIGCDTYSVITSEMLSILQPGDAGFWFTRYLALHVVTWRWRHSGDFSPRSNQESQRN